MSKRIRITGTTVGLNVDTVELYHTSVIPANRIGTGSYTREELQAGIDVDVDDSAEVFFAYANTGTCLGASGSVTNTDKFNSFTYEFSTSGNSNDVNKGSVQEISPNMGSATLNFERRVNWNNVNMLQVEASPGYGISFDGWSNGSPGTPYVSTFTILTVQSGSHSSLNYYANFS